MMFGRRKKKYAKPRKMYDSLRIEEEDKLLEKYGLVKKREIWKADARIVKLRSHAKSLIGTDFPQKNFLEKLKKRGYLVEELADVLALDKENLLKRRFQTLVFEKNLARSVKHARQLIVHKHVAIGKRVVNIPSYHIDVEEEKNISLINMGQEKDGS